MFIPHFFLISWIFKPPSEKYECVNLCLYHDSRISQSQGAHFCLMMSCMNFFSASWLVASHAVVFRGLVLPPPHKRLLTQAPHSFPIVLLPKHPSQSPSRHCLVTSNQIAGYNGRFRFPRALYSVYRLCYSLERCGSLVGIYIFFHFWNGWSWLKHQNKYRM